MNQIIILLAALVLASVAAFFSVSGIAKLFAGSFIPVIIMASSLEMGKLVTASFLTRHWKKLTTPLRTYYLLATTVLVVITSIGIYGFLTAAYQVTSDEFAMLEQQISVLELKKERYQDQLQLYVSDRESLNTRIDELTRGLSNNVIQYRDTVTNEIITTTSVSTRNALQGQLNEMRDQRIDAITKIETFNDSITSMDLQILNIQSSSDVATEIGPLKYLTELTGWPMNKVVNLFTIMIVFVFDPLAISLVIGYNYIKYKDLDDTSNDDTNHKISKFDIRKYKVYGEDDSKNNIPIEEIEPTPIDNEDDIDYYMKPDYDWVNDDRWKSDPDAIKFNLHRGRPV